MTTAAHPTATTVKGKAGARLQHALARNPDGDRSASGINGASADGTNHGGDYPNAGLPPQASTSSPSLSSSRPKATRFAAATHAGTSSTAEVGVLPMGPSKLTVSPHVPVVDSLPAPTRYSLAGTMIVNLNQPVAALARESMAAQDWIDSTFSDALADFAPAMTTDLVAVAGAILLPPESASPSTSPKPSSARPASGLASLLDFDRPQALASFADAISRFAYESTALGNAVASPSGAHHRAWAVTFAVLGVDAALIGYWRASRKRQGKSVREIAAKADPFRLSPL